MHRIVNVVGVGGSSRPGSTAEQALRIVLDAAQRRGASVQLIAGPALAMPMYDPRSGTTTPQASRLLSAISGADGLVLASPAYHGGISGLVKNALDHVEELREGDRPYFSERAVGCVAVANGWQGAASTLAALRDVTHALRGWPTPLGAAINTSTTRFSPAGDCKDDRVQAQLEEIAAQVVDFATRRVLAGAPAESLR
ncbi:NAD(P)H-dependent oxidoreductase [Kitasatospora sp. NA04385]|uniref:NADPH-dependent FMN reductase n=1 Tax=Kitasatospora sp. NA04385 TaxID=2742135 RepID=UPI001591EBB7|nr:NAD(P)H-dependent oxidoreductase [Kitasatospora sp. NA04385]QKW23296.1 NAD(P)H-dependent oxidoreductase [Kitasatospora sp. NA04385]